MHILKAGRHVRIPLQKKRSFHWLPKEKVFKLTNIKSGMDGDVRLCFTPESLLFFTLVHYSSPCNKDKDIFGTFGNEEEDVGMLSALLYTDS